MSDGAAVIVEYTNWRGETARRTIKPLRFWWGNTEYHQEDQWILTAYDCEKKVERDFAWQDMTPVRNPATSAAPSPALAALAMRERAAYECDVYVAYLKAGEASLNNNLGKHIRALSTTFTDAELLAAAMQLPDVRALVEAVKYIMDGYGLNAPDYKQTEFDADGEPVQDDWIVSCLRAALAPFRKVDE